MSRRLTVAPFPRRVAGNPYCDLLYDRLGALGVDVEPQAEFSAAWLIRNRARVGVLHLHWPEYYYRGRGGAVTVRGFAGFVACVLLAKALRYRIVWTIHNALPHDPHRADRFARWLLLRTAHTVVHSRAAERALPAGSGPHAIIPHGSYVGAYADTVSADEARARLGVTPDRRVLLCFGQVRPYKGLADLVQAFRRVDDPRMTLVIAGRAVVAADAEVVSRLAAGDPRILLHLRFIPDEEVQVFFRAADFVVLPYRQVLTSGAAILALSFGRPLIVPRLGCLEDIDEGCAISYDADDPAGLAQALQTARRADPGPLAAHAGTLAAALGWDGIARAYAGVYGIPCAGARAVGAETPATPQAAGDRLSA